MSDLVSQALNLVLYGMGSVFVFLTVLVGVTMLMSFLLQFGVETTKAPERATLPATSVDPKVVAAISAAVKRYREDK